MIVAPSILSADLGNLRAEIAEVAQAGADWIHVDVMDGHFVPNLTLGPPVIAAVRDACPLPFDVHLMIESPERSLEAYVKAGADYLTVHAEACIHAHRTISHIRDLGALPGISLNPSTPVSAVEELIDEVDLVLIMTVNPGFGGQSFIVSQLGKVERIRRLIESSGRSIRLEVDGGVSPSTIRSAADAGADTFVAGSAVFGQDDRADAISQLRTALV